MEKIGSRLAVSFPSIAMFGLSRSASNAFLTKTNIEISINMIKFEDDTRSTTVMTDSNFFANFRKKICKLNITNVFENQ